MGDKNCDSGGKSGRKSSSSRIVRPPEYRPKSPSPRTASGGVCKSNPVTAPVANTSTPVGAKGKTSFPSKSMQKLVSFKMIQKNIKLPPATTSGVESISSGEKFERKQRKVRRSSKARRSSSLLPVRANRINSAPSSSKQQPPPQQQQQQQPEEKSFTLRTKISDSFSNRQSTKFKLKTNLAGKLDNLEPQVGSIFAVNCQKSGDSAIHLLAMTARGNETEERVRQEETVTFIPGKGELRNATLDEQQDPTEKV